MLLAKCCWYDKGWTMCCFFQCSSTDEHNASMQLEKGTLYGCSAKKDKVENYFGSTHVYFPLKFTLSFTMLLFPTIATLLCFPQTCFPYCNHTATLLPPRTICDLRFSVGEHEIHANPNHTDLILSTVRNIEEIHAQ